MATLSSKPPLSLAIHGGAGRALTESTREAGIREALDAILAICWDKLEGGADARDVALLGCKALEDSVYFNAGVGSAIQADGQVRMSAAFMDGRAERLSGVINVERVRNPIDMAFFLQSSKDRILAGEGTALLAREMGLPLFDPIVERRLKEWLRVRLEGELSEQADVSPGKEQEDGIGTVGVVALDESGRLVAVTSTGGRGFERIGRVSDSATAAGNYANQHAAVSCTGIGEDIHDLALAARIVIRATDGLSLAAAMERSIEEAERSTRRLAAIGVDFRGHFAFGKTTELLLGAGRNRERREWAF